MKIKTLSILLAVFLFAGVSFAKDYKRIISLAPSVTKNLYELGIDKEIIAITMYCPKGKFQKEIIGTLLEPDLEKIISLKPDLIIAAKEGNSQILVEKLRKIGISVYIMETANSFEEICNNFFLLAEEIGYQKQAQKIIDEARGIVLSISSKTKNQTVQTLFWEIADKPLYTAGKGSFLNDFNAYTKTKNIYADFISGRYAPVDIEDVISRNPDIIIAADMDGQDLAQTKKKYKNAKAVKNNKVYYLKSDDLFGLTPMFFASALERIYRLIYE
jgi:iron complex transport system substrate-binding protein